MIDMHSHILPNIDDGSKSIEETYELIKEAKSAGFEEIITTPHYIEGYYEVNEIERKKSIESLQTDMRIYLGNEIYLSENIIKLLKEENVSTINGSNYVLFEMPLNTKPMNLYDVVYEILQYKLIPILAHPERYLFVQKDPKLICELIQTGVLMQANYGSIIGQYGTKAQTIIKLFLKNDMIHFLGTDVHRKNTVYPRVPQILDKLSKIISKEKIKDLTTINPKLVLENKKIEFDLPEIKLSLKERVMLKF